MKKRIVSIFLVAAILSSLVMTAYAAEARATRYTPLLSFNGTIANCSVSITAIGKSITATLELWRGNIRVAAWSDSATSRLIISEKQGVTSGQAYTLKLTGSIGGVPLTGTSVTGTCP